MMLSSRWILPAFAAVAVFAGCAHPAAPTFSGADLYARIPELLNKGHVTVPANPRPVEVRADQVLVAADGGSMFELRVVLTGCQGGDPEHDAECTLATLRGQRFRVTNAMPASAAPRAHPDDGLSFGGKALIAALVIGAPLTYGLASCSFAGCKALFGVPLALDACFLALATLGPD